MVAMCASQRYNFQTEQVLVQKLGILSDLIVDMRLKGLDVSKDILNLLRCCKSLVNEYKVRATNPIDLNATCDDLVSYTMVQMANLESYLIIMAADQFGEKYAEEWSKRVGDELIPDSLKVPAKVKSRKCKSTPK